MFGKLDRYTQEVLHGAAQSLFRVVSSFACGASVLVLCSLKLECDDRDQKARFSKFFGL